MESLPRPRLRGGFWAKPRVGNVDRIGMEAGMAVRGSTTLPRLGSRVDALYVLAGVGAAIDERFHRMRLGSLKRPIIDSGQDIVS